MPPFSEDQNKEKLNDESDALKTSSLLQKEPRLANGEEQQSVVESDNLIPQSDLQELETPSELAEDQKQEAEDISLLRREKIDQAK